MTTQFLKPKTSYRKLKVYDKAESIYDLTYAFLSKYIDRRDRTFDQMLQAARSGKQNIAEGRSAAATSRETEIKLYNVARASMHELLEDYRDFARTRDLTIWDTGHPRLEALRNVCKQHNETAFFRPLADKCSSEELVNMLITLLHQFDAMICRIIDYAKEDFLQNGGAREEMSRARIEYRKNNFHYT